ncbi:MAG TPA: hypothetical protein ENI23_09820 [bacterium]|nr:hypothetical protein [bacterium]
MDNQLPENERGIVIAEEPSILYSAVESLFGQDAATVIHQVGAHLVERLRRDKFRDLDRCMSRRWRLNETGQILFKENRLHRKVDADVEFIITSLPAPSTHTPDSFWLTPDDDNNFQVESAIKASDPTSTRKEIMGINVKDQVSVLGVGRTPQLDQQNAISIRFDTEGEATINGDTSSRRSNELPQYCFLSVRSSDETLKILAIRIDVEAFSRKRMTSGQKWSQEFGLERIRA